MGSTITKDKRCAPYKKRDITIRFVPNILADEGRVLKSFPYNRDWTIRRYLKKSGFDFKDMRISVCGHEAQNLSKHLTIGDEIVISPRIEYIPGATEFAAMNLLQQMAIVAFNVATVGMMVYSIYSAFAAKTPKLSTFNTSGEGLDEGPSYAWDGVRTTADVGRPIPVIYGERVVGGNVLNEYVSTDGDNSWLHTLLGIGWGELESVTMRRINRNTAANYSGWSLTTRLGTLNQTVIPNFHDSHNLISVNVQLTQNNAYTYTTDGNDVEAFEIHLSIPGLSQQDEQGNILSWDITYKVEYKLHSAGSWTDLGSTTISKRTRNSFKSIYRKDGLTAGQYDIRITRTSADPSDLNYPITTGELWFERIDEISCEDEQIFPRVALAAVDSLALEQLSGAFPDYELLVKGRKIMTPKVMNGAVDVPWDDYYWDPDDECYKLFSDDTALTWDGETFITAYSANPVWCNYDLQTNRLFGAGHYITPADNDIDLLIEQSQYCEEKVSDGAGGYQKRFRMDIVIDSQQKALDLIMQLCTIFRAYPFYSDKGQVKTVIEKPETPVQLFTPGNIIEKSFSESWGSRRDVPNVVNVQFDDENRNYTTQTVQAYVDNAALIANKPLNSVTVRFYGVKESYARRYGRDYFLALKYISETIKFRSALGSMIRQCGEVIDIAHDVPQWGFGGTVKADFVYKGDYDADADYAANDAVTWTDTLEYKALQACTGIDPTNTAYWAVISRTKVKLDRTVIIESGKSYAIRVDFAKGGYEEGTITDAAGSYTEVNVSTAFSKTPIAYDVYSFGEVDKLVKPGRIMGINRNRNGEIEFEVPEYNENIYDDTAVVISEKKVSSLSTDFPDVTDLTLGETVVTKTDGTIENAIEVSFSKPNLSTYVFNTYKKAKIYYSDNGGISWIYAGETSGTEFVISTKIKIGIEYTVAAVSVGLDGRENDIAGSPQDTITLLGKLTPPADVTGFAYTFLKELVMRWDKNAESDFAGYEIRQADRNWGLGDVTEAIYLTTEDGDQLITESGDNLIAEQSSTDPLIYKGFSTTFTIPAPASRAPGTYYIKAFDTSGNYSANAVAITPVNSAPAAPLIASTQWFGFAKLEWLDVGDSDLSFYEVYKSHTGLWAGEEFLDTKTPGRSATLQGNSPVDVTADSVSSSGLIDAELIGKGSVIGDIIAQTSGDLKGQQATITDFDDETGEVTVDAWPDGTPDAGDEFVIKDRAYYKVRGVDAYGPGEFSSAETVDFTPLTEAEIGDAMISARKLIAGEIITLSAQIKDAIITSAKILGLDAEKINVGTLTGFTIQTAATGSRIVLTPNSLLGYDAAGNIVLQALLTGADAGDVIIGDYAGGKGAKWDKSAGTFDVKGSITATSGDFTGTVNIGTAGKVFIDGANEVINVYDNSNPPVLRVELGKLS